MTSIIPSRTARLIPSPLSPDHVDDVFAVYGDPATWEHLPSGRHTAREQSEASVAYQQESWGRGFATELADAAVTVAASGHPRVPVIARVLSDNRASSAVAQRVGLTLQWRGPNNGVSDGVHREIYATRGLAESQLRWLISRD